MDVEVFSEYRSKCRDFLLPLTGLLQKQKFDVDAYLFWEKYSIENYQLILRYTYNEKYYDFLKYCKAYIFPTLDKKGYLMENFDYEGQSIFVLDMSEWGFDIDQFLNGRYSKMSVAAKEIIMSFHSYYQKREEVLDVVIWMALEPNRRFETLGSKTAMEYVSEKYGFRLDELRRVGELGSIYNRKKETLEMDDSLELVSETVKLT